MRTAALPAAIAAALLLAGCTTAAPTGPTPATSTSVAIPPVTAAQGDGLYEAPEPSSPSYAKTIGPNAALALTCRRMTADERRIWGDNASGITKDAVIDIDSQWRIIVVLLKTNGTDVSAAVTNGTRYNWIGDGYVGGYKTWAGWKGGYQGAGIFFADGPRALAAAIACVNS